MVVILLLGVILDVLSSFLSSWQSRTANYIKILSLCGQLVAIININSMCSQDKVLIYIKTMFVLMPVQVIGGFFCLSKEITLDTECR